MSLLKLIRGRKPEKEKISDKVLKMIYDEEVKFGRCTEIKLSFSDYHGLLFELKKSGQWPYQQHDTAGSSFCFWSKDKRRGLNPHYKNMEIIISVIIGFFALALIGLAAKVDTFQKQQIRLNGEIVKTIQTLNIAINLLNQRLLKAGTEIIELNNAIILPTKDEIN